MSDIVIAVGSNQTNGRSPSLETVMNTRFWLSERGWIILKFSRVFRSPAWPPGSDAPDYVNSVLSVRPEGTPESLLADLHAIEDEQGRVRGARYAPRTLDLDLIAWGDRILPDRGTVLRRIRATGANRDRVPQELFLPHPRMQERAFVLVPMLEVAPDWRHPVLDRTVRQLVDALPRPEIEALTPI